MSVEQDIKESIKKSFCEIVEHESLKPITLEELKHKLDIAKLKIESGLDVKLDLGLLEFAKWKS